MLLYGKKLAVLPFRKDLQEEGDPLEAKPFAENKKDVNILDFCLLMIFLLISLVVNKVSLDPRIK